MAAMQKAESHTLRQHRGAFAGGVSYFEPARTAIPGIRRILGACLLVVLAGIAVTLSNEHPAPSSSMAAAPIGDQAHDVTRGGAISHGRESRGAPGPPDRVVVPNHPFPPERRRDAPDQADGVVPEGTTVFDEVPGIVRLDPALLEALRSAAADAAGDEVALFVESGWRSAEYQAWLLREAVSRYGSEEEASRWVATPETSAHVSGQAVDVANADAVAWLSQHGARYGLCQVYANEPWHYELRDEAIDHGCPPLYDDPTHDRRTHS